MTAGDVSEALPPLAAALRDARVSVLDHWERREAGGHGADEELLTYLLLDAAEPLVRYVDFNRRQEGVVGADWLWWFVDDDGTCFGLLAQAKKLNGAVGGWTVDLGYPGGTQRQLTGLLRASDRLAVPAAYVVYFGRRARRPDVACSVDDAPDCWRCERSGVAVLPALVARQIALSALPYHPEELAPDSYKNSVPLEDLGLPDSAPVRDVNLGAVSAELRDFLLNEQGGARGVAKRIFRVISDDRRFRSVMRRLRPDQPMRLTSSSTSCRSTPATSASATSSTYYAGSADDRRPTSQTCSAEVCRSIHQPSSTAWLAS